MSAGRDYSPRAILGRLVRAIGIVLIFSIAGPLTLAALVSLLAVTLGAALLQMFLALLELEALRTMISVAVALLAIATVLAAFLPSVAAGLIFVAAGPGWGFAVALFTLFVLARIAHTIAYMTARRHEVRATFFSVGSIVVVVMALYALIAALAA